MKKLTAILITVVCLFGLVGCTKEPSDFVGYQIHCTVPAGSSDVIFTGEKITSPTGKFTITAHYEDSGISTLVVWLRDTTIQSAADGNPYTNVDILPGATVEWKLEPNKRYEIGISLVPAAEADIPVKISVHPN
jgi:hypothetical protein